MNDRKRFEELLASSAAMTAMRNDDEYDEISSYLSRDQEEEIIDAYSKN
jgi:hypothetical protein